MKKLFTIIALVVCATSSFAQLKVTEVDKTKTQLIGEYKLLGKSYAKLEKEAGICFLTYRDEKFAQHLDNYKMFYFKEADLDAVYDLFTKFDGIEKGTEKVVELEGGNKLDITYKKTMGQMYAEIVHTDKAGVIGMMRYLTPKQMKELFGKK